MKMENTTEPASYKSNGMQLFDLGEKWSIHSKAEPLINPDHVVCVDNNKGIFYCIDLKCRNHAVICGKQDCECSRRHQQCSSLYKVKNLTQLIEQRKIQQTTLGVYLSQEISKIEDKLSEMQTQLKRKIKYCGLTQNDKDFINLISNSYESMRSNSMVFQQLPGSKVKLFLDQPVRSERKKRKQLSEQLIRDVERIKKYVSSKFDKLSQIIEVQLNEENNGWCKKSTIIKKKHDSCKLDQFLQKAIRYQNCADLIFRGSVDGMSMQEFHSKCENKSNLLYLVENEFGFKYGGYSPCFISIDHLQRCRRHIFEKSFIFSLDTKQQAFITQRSCAVISGRKGNISRSLISFGSTDVNKVCSLVVSENSIASEGQNWINFDLPQKYSSYKVLNEPPSDIECCGKQRQKNCKIKEFQVYQIKESQQSQYQRCYQQISEAL